MTYNPETNPNANKDNTTQGSYAHQGWGNQGGDALWWAKTPGFHPLKAVAVIAGFAIFPPLGVAALVYFIWNSRRHYWAQGPYGFASSGGPGGPAGRGGRCGRGMGRGTGRTGNSAFDEHRANVMNELEKERQDFAAAREDERRRRDKEAFEAFKAGRPNKPEGGSTPPSGTVL